MKIVHVIFKPNILKIFTYNFYTQKNIKHKNAQNNSKKRDLPKQYNTCTLIFREICPSSIEF